MKKLSIFSIIILLAFACGLISNLKHTQRVKDKHINIPTTAWEEGTIITHDFCNNTWRIAMEGDTILGIVTKVDSCTSRVVLKVKDSPVHPRTR